MNSVSFEADPAFPVSLFIRSFPMSDSAVGFSELDLAAPLLKAVTELGYESTLPIQAECIPPLLEGRDIVGIAQTGTGKTAAFALPLLSKIDLSNNRPQVLVLTPTRELAIQVAEAFQAFARYLKGFHVVPIYGGQGYSFQFNQLRRGPQVIVGTPGRVQDHIKRGTLDLSGITSFVLDEADEMLRMGFVEEVEAIMDETPDERQMALFSATMPHQIKRIAQRYLTDPAEVRIQAKTITADNIEQVYLVVPNASKFEALARILETESYDGILIFSRTRVQTMELAERLAARGFDVAPLNGDMNQQARERTINRLKRGQVDIVVATDVAARGLDVDRISLVINFDIPGDSEAYIHRIGRTGRAGRSGKAILFASPRERNFLRSIERVTRQSLKRMEMPSHDVVTQKRVEKFRDKLSEMMTKQQSMQFFQDLSLELMEELELDPMQLAAGLLCMAQQDRPLKAEDNRALSSPSWDDQRSSRQQPRQDRDRGPSSRGGSARKALYRIEVGSNDGVEIRNIMGAIANETGLPGRLIGQIRIHPDYSTIALPDDMPRDIFEHLQKTYVGKKPMKITRIQGDDGYHNGPPAPRRSSPPPAPRRAAPAPRPSAPVAKPAAPAPKAEASAPKPKAAKPKPEPMIKLEALAQEPEAPVKKPKKAAAKKKTAPKTAAKAAPKADPKADAKPKKKRTGKPRPKKKDTK
jgi:ATP-dependent RNA helicase DeaD